LTRAIGRVIARVATNAIRLLREATIGFFRGLLGETTGVLVLQYLDLENAFLTLVLGSLVGIPIVPVGVAMELAPLLKDEVKIMEQRHFLGSDVLAEYFSELGGEW